MQCYYAAFLPAIEGGYIVKFLECPRTVTSGGHFEEAYEYAADVLALETATRAEEQRDMPEPASYEEVLKFAATEMAEEGIDNSREFFVKRVSVPAFPN